MNPNESLSQQQLQHIVQSMRSGVVAIPYALLKGYKQLKLSELEVMVILQVMAFKDREHQHFPTLDELQARIAAPANEVISAIQRLIKAQFISIDEAIDSHTGVQYERYNLQQLYLKLAELIMAENADKQEYKPSAPIQSSATQRTTAQTSAQFNTPASAQTNLKSNAPAHKAENEKNLYVIIEREFGRPLTPMELETISSWIDKDRYHEEVILAALKEAVFSGKLNFRYIDRILLDWSRHQITTAEMAKTYSQQFRQSR